MDRTRTRLFFTLLIPFLALIVGGAVHIGRDRVKSEQDLIRKNEIGYVITAIRHLEGQLALPIRQLRAAAPLADDPAALAELITQTGLYDRILRIAADGRESARVARLEDRGVIVEPGADPLVLNLQAGQARVFPMQRAQDGRPYLRLALGLAEGGALVFDVSARPLLEGFSESVVEARDHAMLLDDQGRWLKSPASGDEWSQATLAQRDPEAWKTLTAIPSGQVEREDGLWTWGVAYPLQADDSRGIPDLPGWLAVTHLPHAQLVLVSQGIWSQVMASAAILLLVFAAVAAWLARALAQSAEARAEAARAQAEAAAAHRINESLERFHLIVEANVNGVLAVDRFGHIVLANPALERMFGYDHDELLGKPMDILLPESLRAGHAGLRGGYMSSPVARPMGEGRVLAGRRKDGSEFPLEISLSPYTEHGEPFVDAIVVDVSGRAA